VPPREVISADAIARRVAELGAEIDARLPPGPLTVVGVLRGAFMFMADLVRAIPRDLTCDFLGVRSYGDATVSSGGPPLDFVGFDAPDAFVVGYGLDAAQLYRNLPYVAALDPAETRR